MINMMLCVYDHLSRYRFSNTDVARTALKANSRRHASDLRAKPTRPLFPKLAPAPDFPTSGTNFRSRFQQTAQFGYNDRKHREFSRLFT